LWDIWLCGKLCIHLITQVAECTQLSKYCSALWHCEFWECVCHNLPWWCDPQFFKQWYSEIQHRFDTVSPIPGAAPARTSFKHVYLCLRGMWSTLSTCLPNPY
jgi:hypothetical protein